MSIQAYQRASAQGETPREAEYRLFALITSGLIRASESRKNISGLAEALHQNRRLWSLLAQDCADPENTLPKPLRAQIISLSLWVSRHTSAVMRDGSDIEPLIEVNRSVMQGLAPGAHAPLAAVG
ncbi:MAG: flagellar biosynthesis regulator FlaF [Hyphomonadaceae bacterium]